MPQIASFLTCCPGKVFAKEACKHLLIPALEEILTNLPLGTFFIGRHDVEDDNVLTLTKRLIYA